MRLSKIVKKLLQEGEQQPLQLTYDKYYGGNAKSKARRKKVEEEKKITLEMFRNWRTLKEFEDKRQEKVKEYYQPKKEEAPTKKEKVRYLIYKVNKNGFQKLGRFHYLNNFIIACLISLIYLVAVDFNLFKNIFWFLICSATLTVATIYFFTNSCYSARIVTHIDSIDISKYVILRMGEPGTGKSSSACYDSFAMADKVWHKLQFKYWLIKKKIEKIYSGTYIKHTVLGKDKNGRLIIHYERVYTGSKDKIEKAVEIVEAYEFYKDHPEIIPCLYSSIPVEDEQGRTSLQFTADHLLQKENLLGYGVAFLDEIGSMLPPQLSNQKIELIDLSFRFIRQFHEFHLISTEQDGKAVVISARRVTAENKRMIAQKHILKPIILSKICDKLEERIIEKDVKPTATKVALMSAFRNYVDSVGFRKFSFIDNGNLQFQAAEGVKGNVKSRVQTFITAPHLNCKYDDRAFKNLNKAKNQAPNPVKWNGLVLQEKELNKFFNREILARAYK